MFTYKICISILYLIYGIVRIFFSKNTKKISFYPSYLWKVELGTGIFFSLVGIVIFILAFILD